MEHAYKQLGEPLVGAPAGGPITLAERAAAVRDGIETKTSSVT